jgi:lipopolysaccharide export system permease protein
VRATPALFGIWGILGTAMRRLSVYILKQLIGPVVLFTFLMTAVIWLTQALHYLDLIINRGQSATTFAYLTMLIVPSLLVLILPLAFFFGALYALSRLNTESELVVMSSAGFSRAQLAIPTLTAAVLVMGLTWVCSLYLMPAGQRALDEKLFDISANISTALFNEGTFNTPAKGLTVFIRSIDANGGIHGVLVHDNRNAKSPITYLAESGSIVQTPAGARLILNNGTIQRIARHGARLNIWKFERTPFDLDQFVSAAPVTERKAKEMLLGELLHPDPHTSARARRAYTAEAHSRIAEPFYCIAFALIALAAVTQGRRARGAHLLRLTVACAAASLLRIAGYGIAALASGNSAYCVLFYLLPLIGVLGAVGVLSIGLPKPRPDLVAGPSLNGAGA